MIAHAAGVEAAWGLVEAKSRQGRLLWLEENQMWEAYFRRRDEGYAIGGHAGEVAKALTAADAITLAYAMDEGK